MARYLIFGGTGSLGKKLIDRLLPEDSVAVYSRDEAKHWTIKNDLADHPNIIDLEFYVGDIRDINRVRDVIRQVDPTHIIIAAALKQVDTCELSPNESVSTNLIGTQNVVTVVNESTPQSSLKAVLFVSTDKACSPVNVYGMCKAISERIVTSQARTGVKHVSFHAVRYGNVLESRGSIIPLFKHQAENAEFLTVTDPNMTRFVMTLDDSVDLILATLSMGNNGWTWIPKPPAMRIGDLAEIFSEQSGKPIKIIGLRPGEKSHEDLINESESVRTCSDGANEHYLIAPAFLAGDNKPFTYTSADSVMTKDQLRAHLSKLGILNAPLEQFKGLAIEEIITKRKK
jgi:UDP-N-acetylglucosamine 4,6-dehydratase/5-epimerase